MTAPARYTSITPPSGNCPGCAAIQGTRAFCRDCRGDRPCTWCGGRGWRTAANRFGRCDCTV